MRKEIFILIFSLQISYFAICQEKLDFDYYFLPASGKLTDAVFKDVNGDNLIDAVNLCVELDAQPYRKWILIYLQTKDGKFPPTPSFSLPVSPFITAIVVGDLIDTGANEIGFMAEDGLYYFPFQNGKFLRQPRKLLHTETFFQSTYNESIFLWEYVYDLDGDNLEDIIIPAIDTFKVYFQRKGGRWKVSYLPREPLLRAGVTTIRSLVQEGTLTPSHFVLQKHLFKLYICNVNADEKKDIVLVIDDNIISYIQDDIEEGKFNWNIVTRIVLQKAWAQGSKLNFDAINFDDIDGDGNADFIIVRYEATLGVLKTIETSICIYYGFGNGDFEVEPMYLRIKGVSMLPVFLDVDGDGAKDISVSRLRTDIINPELLIREVAISYGIYKFDKTTRRYSEHGVYQRDVLVRVADLEEMGLRSIPLMYFEKDFTGDANIDSITFEPSQGKIHIRRGYREKNFINFEKNILKELTIQKMPKRAKAEFINGDGLSDLILFYSSGIGIFLSKAKRD